MIAVILYSLLLILGLIYTLISTIPSTKKFLSLCFQSLHDHKYDPPKPAAAAAGGGSGGGGGGGVDLRKLFATFDKNDDGYITKKELRESLKNMGISAGEKDVDDMVEKVDSNGDGLIDLDEFCKLLESISAVGEDDEVDGRGSDEDLREAFEVFDGNKDGLITVEELGLVLSSLGFTQGKKLEDCKEMITKVDLDGDGMVNFDEFKRMMKSGLGTFFS